MLKRIKSKTGKPLCLGDRANVLIHKQDYNWFKITIFVKDGPTVSSDWLYIPNDAEDKAAFRDTLIIDEVNDVLEEWDEGELLDLAEQNGYQIED